MKLFLKLRHGELNVHSKCLIGLQSLIMTFKMAERSSLLSTKEAGVQPHALQKVLSEAFLPLDRTSK
jgi:hypothetical protein